MGICGVYVVYGMCAAHDLALLAAKDETEGAAEGRPGKIATLGPQISSVTGAVARGRERYPQARTPVSGQKIGLVRTNTMIRR